MLFQGNSIILQTTINKLFYLLIVKVLIFYNKVNVLIFFKDEKNKLIHFNKYQHVFN